MNKHTYKGTAFNSVKTKSFLLVVKLFIYLFCLFFCLGSKWQLGTTLCPFGPGGGPVVHASYHHKISDTLQIGAEFETAAGIGESSASGGYQIDIPNVGITFKGKALKG